MEPNLICVRCAATGYSAAARFLLERNERCTCGGPLADPAELAKVEAEVLDLLVRGVA